MKRGKPLEELFVTHLESSRLISPNSRGVVAVSGGVDSVVLLNLLIAVSKMFNLSLGIAHFNHKTRAKESDEDEQFVKRRAEENGFTFYCSALSQQPSDSMESWESYARRFRYEFLEKTRIEGNYNWVATGHHADDQTETLLMRIIEGSGIRGLTGIQERHHYVIRPMLLFSKEQIVGYAREKNLMYRDDPTNIDTKFDRNYIRHELIPGIRKLNPGFVFSMSRLAENIGEFDHLIQKLVNEKRKRIVTKSESDDLILDATLLSGEPKIIQKRLIHNITSSDVFSSLWRYPVWSALGKFLNKSSTGDVLHLPDGWKLLRNRDQYLLHRASEEDRWEGNQEIQFWPDRLVSVPVHRFSLTMQVIPEPMDFTNEPHIEFVDYDKLAGKRMALRLWRSGDKMKPLGLLGYKKVSDLLVDEKVNRFEKEHQFVLTAGDEIVWLCGVRLDDRFKVGEKTSQVAKLSWLKQSVQ